MAGPLTPSSRLNPLSPQDPAVQLTTFKSYISILADNSQNIAEKKLKAAQELCESFEIIGSLPQYPSFLLEAVTIFLKILQDEEPVFITEFPNQQLRKMLLELIHRIPSNEHLKPHVGNILNLMFKLLEIDNEENALVCLRIIIELIKQYRPAFSPEVMNFLKFVKNIYRQLQFHLNELFVHRTQIKKTNISEKDAREIVEEILTVTTIVTPDKNSENQYVSYSLVPKASNSLKVLAELPIIVVVMYQFYKQHVHNDIADFIPLIMSTINFQPTSEQKASNNFNKEVYADFIAAQIKTLSFLAYVVRIYQDTVAQHSPTLIKGLLSLLTNCPTEGAHLRKELLIAARHILATDLRIKFVPYIDKLFNEDILIGSGYTTYESLRPLAYSTLADLVHHIRHNLSMNDLGLAVNLFSKNIHDESLPSTIQNMSCKLLLNLVECIRTKSDGTNGREFFFRMLEVFVLKFKTISQVHLPNLLQKCKQNCIKVDLEKLASQANPPSSPASLAKSKSALTFSAEDPKSQGLAGLSVSSLGLDKEDIKMDQKSFQASTVIDCRSLVKTLVSGVKTITWGISTCKNANNEQMKHLQSLETLVYINLIEYALHALDVYTISISAQGMPQIRGSNSQLMRSKKEKSTDCDSALIPLLCVHG